MYKKYKITYDPVKHYRNVLTWGLSFDLVMQFAGMVH
jgi:hypothetical protein